MTITGVRQNFSWLLSSKFFLILIGVITGGVINRALGLAGRGILAEMQTWAALFAVIFSFSIDTVTYHCSNRSTYPQTDQTKFVTLLLLNLIYSFIAVFFLTLFVVFIPRQVSPSMSEFLVLWDIFLVVFILSNNLTIFFQALGNIKLAAVVGLLQGVFSLVIISVGYFLDLLNLRFVVVYQILVQLSGLIIIGYIVLKEKWLNGVFSPSLARQMVKAGVQQHIATVATFVYTKINQIIVYRYCGEAAAGLLAVPLTIATYLIIVPNTLQTVLYPRVIHEVDSFEVTIRALRLAFYAWGGLIVMIILFAKPILFVYGGSKFLEATGVFRVLMIGFWLFPLSGIVAPYCVKVGAFLACSISALIVGVLSIVINLLLVPKFSAVGAAWATSLTCIFGFILSLLLLRYTSKRNPLTFLQPKFSKRITCE